MVVITWNETSSTSIILTKDNGSKLTLSIGDFIGHDDSLNGAVITEFTGKDPAGPIGMIYLSRREDRWATPLYSLKGNPRHAICPPVGLIHYGIHLNWNSVYIKGPCPDDKWKH
jgi:hypothetical protein